MKSAMTVGALVPTITHIRRGLLLLGMLTLFALFGIGVTHARPATAPTGAQIAASVGDIRIENGGG